MPLPVGFPPPPKPPPAEVQRFKSDGKPTEAQIKYENDFRQWLIKLMAAIP